MSHAAIHEQLTRLGQLSLWEQVSLWSEKLQQEALRDLKRIDAKTLQEQRRLIHASSPVNGLIEPWTAVSFSEDCVPFEERGLEILREGKAACLLVAGGQGTRLGLKGPKGCFPVSPVQHKSLFQIHAENVFYAGKKVGRALPLIVMTSSENRRETEEFFIKHKRFGLAEDQLFFIEQEDLPLLTAEGNLFFTEPGKLAKGPNGNGDALKVLYRSGLGEKLRGQGIEWITLILVDNPLADPFDLRLIGYHADKKADITIKCIARTDPKEKVGVIVREMGKVAVREYTELNGEEENLGSHRYANISLFCFSLSFAARAEGIELPLHQVFKANFYKCERFIFDLLPYSSRTQVLVYPRDECFAPLKKLEDLPLLQEKLREADQRLLKKLTGKEYQAKEVERSFHYLTQEQSLTVKAVPPRDASYLTLDINENLA